MHEADPHLGSDFGFMGLLLSQRLWKLHSQYLPEWVYTAGETKALGEIAKSYICTPAGNKWRSLSISFLLSEACRPCNQTRRPYSKTIVSDDSLLRKESVSLRMLANKTKWKTGSLHNFYLMSHNFGDDSWALIQISKTTLWTYGPFIRTGPELGAPSAVRSIEQRMSAALRVLSPFWNLPGDLCPGHSDSLKIWVKHEVQNSSQSEWVTSYFGVKVGIYHPAEWFYRHLWVNPLFLNQNNTVTSRSDTRETWVKCHLASLRNYTHWREWEWMSSCHLRWTLCLQISVNFSSLLRVGRRQHCVKYLRSFLPHLLAEAFYLK